MLTIFQINSQELLQTNSNQGKNSGEKKKMKNGTPFDK